MHDESQGVINPLPNQMPGWTIVKRVRCEECGAVYDMPRPRNGQTTEMSYANMIFGMTCTTPGCPHNNPARIQLRFAVRTIKPRDVFQDVRDLHQIIVPLPTIMTGGGPLMALETYILIALIKIHKPEVLFEFGTFLGMTTAALALNTVDQAKIYTLDLGTTEQVGEIAAPATSIDDALRETSANLGTPYISSIPPDKKAKIVQILGDSRAFAPSSYGLLNTVDFVFVDGGHDTETVKSDTENALKMLKPGGIIIWHDYNSKIDHGVTEVVNDLSQSLSINHVTGTMLAYHIVTPKL